MDPDSPVPPGPLPGPGPTAPSSPPPPPPPPPPPIGAETGPWPDHDGPADPPALLPTTRTERAGTVAAWCVPVLLLAALAVSLVPVRNGRVQDCGTPLAFVSQGRTENVLPDVDQPGQRDTPPKNFTAEEYEEAAERSCRERVAPRMVWAAGLTLAALLLAIGGAVATVVGRYWLSSEKDRHEVTPRATPP